MNKILVSLWKAKFGGENRRISNNYKHNKYTFPWEHVDRVKLVGEGISIEVNIKR